MFPLHHVKISVLLLTTLLLQGCFTYKTTSFEEMKIGKYYRVQIADGREITTKYLDVSASDELIFKARNRSIHVSKEAIKSVERRRNSPVTYLVGFGIPAFLVFEVLRNDNPSLQEEISDRVGG